MMKIGPMLICFAVLLTGCVDDAPRDNPLDPDSSGFLKEGGLNGRIIIANQTTGIAGATVWNLTETISVVTDSSGNFSFGKLSTGTHRFVVTKTNFTNDTFQISIQSGATSQIVRGLNGAPVVIFQQILTRKIDYFSFSPRYFVDISAAVTDPNGIADLDSVWFGVDTIRFPLAYSVSEKNFLTAIDKGSFPTNTIEWLIGKPLHIISKDVHGAYSSSESFYISRMIENTGTPIKQDTTNSTPLFKWTPPVVNFNYTSTVTVYRAGTETIVWSSSGLISFFEELQFPTNGTVLPLTPGNYFWTITIVDDFGNYSRSRESYFVVK
jgi:hypothetical protein